MKDKSSGTVSPPFLIGVLILASLSLAYVITSSVNVNPNQQTTLIPTNMIGRNQVASLDDASSGLVGWWKFDEGSGATATDSAGANMGTLVNGSAWVSGKIGNGALSFDGTNNYVNAGSNSGLNFGTGSFSIAFWMNANALPTNQYGGRGGLVSKINEYGSQVICL